MPCFGECFISLSSHPDSQHYLAPIAFLPLLVLQFVPLRCQWRIGWHPQRNFIQIKQNPPHKIILPKILILDSNFKQMGLQPLFGESKNLIPNRVLILLQMFSDPFVVTQFHFYIRV
uniref:Uncharacterized protein n=1 Tax=Opuntia streptacantha TaxID=393608 RepID=A0A7C8YZS8_OPUST